MLKKTLKHLKSCQDRKIDQIQHIIKESNQKLEADIAQVQHKLEGDIAQVRREMIDLKSDLIRWMMGLLIGQTALLVSVVIGLKIFGA